MPEDIKTTSTKLSLTPKEREELYGYLKKTGIKLGYFLRQAVIEKLERVNGGGSK